VIEKYFQYNMLGTAKCKNIKKHRCIPFPYEMTRGGGSFLQ
jgi:hypothetical protein